jgi:hypothetical protein
VALVAAGLTAACGSPPAPAVVPPRLGFSAAAFDKQRDLEQRFRSSVSADELGKFHGMVTPQPHMAGTDGGRDVAEYIRGALAAAGLSVEVIEYQAYLSFSKTVAVDIVAPMAQGLRVTEPASAIDPDTQNSRLGPGFARTPPRVM